MDEIKRTKEYDEKLRLSIYGIPKIGNYQELLSEISMEKGETGLLRNAIKVYFDKKDNSIKVVAPTICDVILKNYKSVDKSIYQELVHLIYTSQDIARTKVEGSLNPSFLVQVLQNHDIALTEDQKAAAVREAINMPGAIFFPGDEEMKKSKIENHGLTHFDIRYEILMNPNWKMTEKADLIYDFYKKDQDFNEAISTWEEEILCNSSTYSIEKGFEAMHPEELVEYSCDEIAKYYPNKEQAKEIEYKLSVCKLFHQIRPTTPNDEKKNSTARQKK